MANQELCFICKKREADVEADVTSGAETQTIKVCDPCAQVLKTQIARANENPEEFQRAFLDLIEKVDIPEHKKYAAIKTGRILTVNNWEKVPKEARQEWNEAIKEYFQIHKTPFLVDIRLSSEGQVSNEAR